MQNDNRRPWSPRILSLVLAFGTIVSLVVVLGGLAVPMQATMISGTVTANATLTPTGTPGIFIQNLNGNGETIFDGSTPTPTMLSSTATVDFSNPPMISLSNGMFLETFSNGTLFGDCFGSGVASGMGTATFTVDYQFLGGTGAYAGDTGQLIATGTVTQTSPTTEAASGSFTGSLSTTPEPATVALLATGLAGFVLLRRFTRQRPS